MDGEITHLRPIGLCGVPQARILPKHVRGPKRALYATKPRRLCLREACAVPNLTKHKMKASWTASFGSFPAAPAARAAEYLGN
jgi:hypothetical protein